jgi:hypothetical protein
MKKSQLFWILGILLGGALLASCSAAKKSGANQNDGNMGISSPPAVVYKTKKDYAKNVPVTLSEDGSSVVSYPAQSDIRKGDSFAYPTELSEGYLLDNRGISPNTAFLRFTYEDYYNMDNIPTAERLMDYIMDDAPFSEYYEVGLRGDYENIEKAMNEIIEGNKLKKYKNLAK